MPPFEVAIGGLPFFSEKLLASFVMVSKGYQKVPARSIKC
jgi:hypothetical protein